MSSPEFNLDNVRPRPALIDALPGLSPNAGTAIYPYVYVGRVLYENLISDEPDESGVALVLHEQEHIKRIKETGVFKWYSRYMLSRSFRLEEEIAAMKPQFTHLQRTGMNIDLAHRAKVLSSGVYLWPTNYKDAYSRLSAVWDSNDISSE